MDMTELDGSDIGKQITVTYPDAKEAGGVLTGVISSITHSRGDEKTRTVVSVAFAGQSFDIENKSAGRYVPSIHIEG